MTIKAFFKWLYFRFVSFFRKRKKRTDNDPEVTCYMVLPLNNPPEQDSSAEESGDSPSPPHQLN